MRHKLTQRELEILAVYLKDMIVERGQPVPVRRAAAHFGVGKGDIKRAARILKLHVQDGVLVPLQPLDKGTS